MCRGEYITIRIDAKKPREFDVYLRQDFPIASKTFDTNLWTGASFGQLSKWNCDSIWKSQSLHSLLDASSPLTIKPLWANSNHFSRPQMW
eukprot:160673-Pleurochrysis_carterae.AAC.1